MAPNDLWYVQSKNSASVGPVSTELLARGVRAGRVPLSANICPLGGKDWVPLATHPSFADIVRELAPPPPPPPPSRSKPDLASVPVTFDAHDLVEDEKTVIDEPRSHGGAAPTPPAVPTAPTAPFQQAPVEAPLPRPFVAGGVVPPKPPANGWLSRNVARLRDLPALDRKVAAVILGSCFGVGLITVVVALVLLRDAAKQDYERCVKLEASGNLKDAANACSAAVAKDPESKSGKAASMKLTELQATLVQLEAEAEAAASAAERRRLLASSDPIDLTNVMTKYPGSQEAAEARGKLARVSSICADLETWLSDLERNAHYLTLVGGAYRAGNRTAKSAGAVIENGEKTGKQCADRGADLREKLGRLKAHHVLPGEETVLSDLAKGYSSLATFFEGYGELLPKVAWDLPNHGDAPVRLAALNELVSSTWSPSEMKRAREYSERKCKSVPSPSAATSSPPDTGTDDNDGTAAKRPVLPAADDGFVDPRGGWGWGDKCYVNIKAQKWGWAKAECDQGMALNPASPNPRAGLLYNEGLIAKAAGNLAEARQDFTSSLALREHPDVRAALESVSPSPPPRSVPAAPAPVPQPSKGGDCGCNDDLMCLMKCHTH